MLFTRYVLECAECGVIYRSRQYWFGNDDPVKTVVRTELRHVWPGVRFGYYEKLDMSFYCVAGTTSTSPALPSFLGTLSNNLLRRWSCMRTTGVVSAFLLPKVKTFSFRDGNVVTCFLPFCSTKLKGLKINRAFES